MKTWDDWSDGDINLSICERLNLSPFARVKDTCEVVCGIDGESVYKDYCNNPADMWPIIVENGICLTSPTTGRNRAVWSASWNEYGGRWSSGDIVFGDKNPLRAAAIVFLEMNGVSP